MKKHVIVSEEVHWLLSSIDIDHNVFLEYLFFGMDRVHLNLLLNVIQKMNNKGEFNSSKKKHVLISDNLHSLLYKIKRVKGLCPNDVIESVIYALGAANLRTLVKLIKHKESLDYNPTWMTTYTPSPPIENRRETELQW